MNTIDEMVRGSIDMHVHHSPDARIRRRLDALGVARQAQEAGMRAIVLKSHDYPTAPLAYIVSQIVKDVSVFGSICLDLDVGGLNPRAVDTSARLGAKVVWMPTFTSANDRRKRNLPGEGISILDENNNLVPAVGEILDIIKSYDIAVATGHLSGPEVFALVREAKRRGITKIVVTHPLAVGVGATLSLSEQKQLVDEGAFIEHCFIATMPLGDRIHPAQIVEAVKTVGAEHCILSTDLGQEYNPAPAEGMRMMVATMLQPMKGGHLSEEEIKVLIKTNPARLLGLD